MDEEHWATVIQSNLKSVYLPCHRMANILVDQGKRGSIINMALEWQWKRHVLAAGNGHETVR